jgi:cation transport ATPase
LSQSTDEALAASGFVLLHGNLAALPVLFQAGKKLTRVVRDNYFWAFAFNTFFVPVAAWGQLTPLMAMLLMLTSSTAVLLNSLRLRKIA